MHPRLSRMAASRTFALLGWLVAAAAVAWALWANGGGDGAPRLTYALQPLRTAVVHEDNPSDLQVLYRGKPIEGPITAVEIVLWNDGTRTIRPEHVLRSVVVRTADGSAILDVQATPSNPEGRFRVQRSGLGQGRAPVEWTFLAPGEGATLRVLYAGGGRTDIVVDGRIEGQGSILRIDLPEGTVYPRPFRFDQRDHLRRFMLLLIGVCGVMSAVMFALPVNESELRWFRWLFVLAFLALSIIYLREFHWLFKAPPVGFD